MLPRDRDWLVCWRCLALVRDSNIIIMCAIIIYYLIVVKVGNNIYK